MSDLISRQAAIDAMNAKLEDIKLRWRRKVKKGEIAMYLDMRGTIETLPSAEPEELIRCEDCIHHHGYICDRLYGLQDAFTLQDDDYCSRAEPKETES